MKTRWWVVLLRFSVHMGGFAYFLKSMDHRDALGAMIGAMLFFTPDWCFPDSKVEKK